MSEAREAELKAMNATLAEDLRAVGVELERVWADRDDYERRWLAECREHGETRRALEALRARVDKALKALLRYPAADSRRVQDALEALRGE